MTTKSGLQRRLQRELEDLEFDMDECPRGGDVNRLREVYEKFLVQHEFQQGQLVQWKSGCKNKRMPPEGEAVNDDPTECFSPARRL